MKAHLKKSTAVVEMKAHEILELALIMDEVHDAIKSGKFNPRTAGVANLVLRKYDGLFRQMTDCWEDGGEYETEE